MCIASIFAKQWIGKHVPVATNTHATIEQLLNAWFSMRFVLYQRRVCVSVCVYQLSLLGNGSVNIFPPERKIVCRVVFYVVLFLLKESRRFVLPRYSCLFLEPGQNSCSQLTLPSSSLNVICEIMVSIY
jgi:hypothetical protein